MKKLLLLLIIPLLSFGQTTMIPDANFEQRLISFGYDDVLDGTVLTAAIDTVTQLGVSYYGISDLTGIEDFTALTYLNCVNNDLTSLDVSQSANLTDLNCNDNQLTILDIRNGNNINLVQFNANNNPYLYCTDVDDPTWMYTYWSNWINYSNLRIFFKN